MVSFTNIGAMSPCLLITQRTVQLQDGVSVHESLWIFRDPESRILPRHEHIDVEMGFIIKQ